jgi:hypothetical protein
MTSLELVIGETPRGAVKRWPRPPDEAIDLSKGSTGVDATMVYRPPPHARTGITIAFPDVSQAPAPPAGAVPLPYPFDAARAGAAIPMVPGAMRGNQGGDIAGAGGVVGAGAMMSPVRLRATLNQLNAKLQGLQSGDPNQWQGVLQEYVVAASALYKVNVSR